jgi:hypothetical protein
MSDLHILGHHLVFQIPKLQKWETTWTLNRDGNATNQIPFLNRNNIIHRLTIIVCAAVTESSQAIARQGVRWAAGYLVGHGRHKIFTLCLPSVIFHSSLFACVMFLVAFVTAFVNWGKDGSCRETYDGSVYR